MSQLCLLLKIQFLSLFDINKRLHSGKQAMAGIVAVAQHSYLSRLWLHTQSQSLKA